MCSRCNASYLHTCIHIIIIIIYTVYLCISGVHALNYTYSAATCTLLLYIHVLVCQEYSLFLSLSHTHTHTLSHTHTFSLCLSHTYILLVHCLFLTQHCFAGVSSNHSAVAEVLLEGGADINARDWEGGTALTVATNCGHLDVLRILLKHPNVDLDTQVHVHVYNNYVMMYMCAFYLWCSTYFVPHYSKCSYS